ncbi:MAG: 4Fe-4S binding protein [Spirochaetes bacterium]|nr:4Fe-4S binding protein [Spirochaetota bacterium]
MDYFFAETLDHALQTARSKTAQGKKVKFIAGGKCQEVCAYDAVISGGKYSINPDACIGCGLCVSICPTEAIAQTYYKL